MHRFTGSNEHPQPPRTLDVTEAMKCQHEIVPANWREYGLSTLRNYGTTCYLNSGFQCLAHTMPLTEYFISDTYRRDRHQITTSDQRRHALVLDHYVQLLKGFWNGNWVITPRSFIQMMNRYVPHLNPYNQEDSSECVVFLLDCFHESLAYPARYSINPNPQSRADRQMVIAFGSLQKHYRETYSRVLKLFGGQYHSRTQCVNRACRVINHSYHPFIFIEIPMASTLRGCFERLCRTEALDHNNGYRCEHCSQTTQALQKLTFWKLPPILIITLKRFETNRWGYPQKNLSGVELPMTDLNLVEFMSGPQPLGASSYQLYAVNCHVGQLSGGHYFSFCHHLDRWWRFDDHCKAEVPTHVVQKQIMTEGYMLFYRRSDMIW